MTCEFDQIVNAHYAALYRFALSMSRDRDTAQDLVQQTFLQWARKGHLLRDKSKVKSWLFTTLYREYLAVSRRNRLHKQVEFVADLHGGVEAGEASPSRELDPETLQQALEAVDPLFRAPLVLFYLQEMSYREIAETLGVALGTVMSRLGRGRARLRAELIRMTGDPVPSAGCDAAHTHPSH